MFAKSLSTKDSLTIADKLIIDKRTLKKIVLANSLSTKVVVAFLTSVGKAIIDNRTFY